MIRILDWVLYFYGILLCLGVGGQGMGLGVGYVGYINVIGSGR